jgi:hypothetical protein
LRKESPEVDRKKTEESLQEAKQAICRLTILSRCQTKPAHLEKYKNKIKNSNLGFVSHVRTDSSKPGLSFRLHLFVFQQFTVELQNCSGQF